MFYKSIEPNNTVTRQTALCWFFTTNNNLDKTEIIIEEDYILNYQNINNIDPMIGMDDIKPQTSYKKNLEILFSKFFLIY